MNWIKLAMEALAGEYIRGKLLDLARMRLDDVGYNYVNKKSRSKTFVSENDIEEDKVVRRQKLTKDNETKKDTKLCEDIHLKPSTK